MDKRAVITPVYPGSFDPVTLGHLDIIERALGIFGRLVVAVAENSGKQSLFSVPERVSMLREVVPGETVTVESFRGTLVSWLAARGLNTVIRGMRSTADFEHEYRMALANRRMMPGVETLFLFPSENHACFNSGLVRELAELGADLSPFVPAEVAGELKKKFQDRGKNA